MPPQPIPAIIDDYCTRYTKEYDYYVEVARRVASVCQQVVGGNGIRAIVTSRAKRPDRLRAKLLQRWEAGTLYQTLADVDVDIVDLAGVRVAVYFPTDRERLRELLGQMFDVVTAREFPMTAAPDVGGYHKRFSGYGATHFRVRLPPNRVDAEDQRFCVAVCEIQVASVLMHAWSEVEHDLVYKPTSGELSRTELAILDELNGLVLAGEIALERLQAAQQERVTRPETVFSNHYELAAFLHQRFKEDESGGEEPVMGRADVLFLFLSRIGKLSRASLEPYLTGWTQDTEGHPLAQQVADRCLEQLGDPDRYEIFAAATREVGAFSPYREGDAAEPAPEGGTFIHNWATLEMLARSLTPAGGDGYRRASSDFEVLWQRKLLTEDWRVPFRFLREQRNALVHGTAPNQGPALGEASRLLTAMFGEIRDNAAGSESEVVQRVLGLARR